MRSAAAIFVAITLVPLATRAASRVVTIEEGLASTRQRNVTWKTLEQNLKIADAGRDIGIAMFLPKLQAEGQWLHLGERHTPDVSGFDAIGTLTQVVLSEHPARAADFSSTAGSGDGFSFDDFVPAENTLAATFSLVVPVINLSAIPRLQGAYDRYDAAVQRVGYGRDQLLLGVAKAYYGLVTLQGMIDSSERSVAAARRHYQNNTIKAELHAATQLEVKRAELELAKAESRKAALSANLEKAKAAFRYLTGIEGDFAVTEPQLAMPAMTPARHWLDLAKTQRKDLLATRIEALAADHDVDGAWTAYLPTGNLIGQAKLDNNEAQRFDTDAFSWTVMATLTMNVWDGGIREADLKINEARRRQSQLAVVDLEEQITSGVTSASQSLADAATARRLAARQLEVAKATEALTQAGADAGAVTTLEVIDVNTMVFVSEAGLLAARLTEATAYLDLLAAAGEPLPFAE